MDEEDRSVSPREPVSELLAAWATRGDAGARDRLVPLVYAELHRLAHHYMRGERKEHTLQPTALVNEVFLRLAGVERIEWRNRAHFVAMAATLMRRILVDYARDRGREKRGGGVSITSIEGHDVAAPDNAVAAEGAVSEALDVVALDAALAGLAALDARQSQIVELRFFGGMTIDETAEALAISPGTVKREWATAKLWLHHELSARPRS